MVYIAYKLCIKFAIIRALLTEISLQNNNVTKDSIEIFRNVSRFKETKSTNKNKRKSSREQFTINDQP